MEIQYRKYRNANFSFPVAEDAGHYVEDIIKQIKLVHIVRFNVMLWNGRTVEITMDDNVLIPLR